LQDWIGDFSERLKLPSIGSDVICDYQNMYNDFFEADDATLYGTAESSSSLLRKNFAKVSHL